MQFRPFSAVPIRTQTPYPKMAVALAGAAHDEPFESFPFRIAKRRNR